MASSSAALPTSHAADLVGRSNSSSNNNDPSSPLTLLEQEVLDEYARLLGNLNNVRTQ